MPKIWLQGVKMIQTLKVHLKWSYQIGVPVGCADPCQHQKRTNVAENVCVRPLMNYFQNICIDREVLTVAIRARCDIRVEEPDYGDLVNWVGETEKFAQLVLSGL